MKRMVDPISSEWIQLKYGSRIDWDIWDVGGSGKKKEVRHQVYCGLCGQTRMVYRIAIKNRIRSGTPYTGLCLNCHILENPPPPGRGISKNLKTGTLINRQGYRHILISSLSPIDLALALPMAYNNAKYVPEHRLVMARHLNRPLLKCEVVHHKNGVRYDNRLDNLELLTTRAEHKHGHGDDYYQLWQEALAEIERLRCLLSDLSAPDHTGAMA